MSNLLFMDESNGNGGYVTSTTTSTAAAAVAASVSRTISNKNIQNNNNNNNNNISNGINNIHNNININNNNNNNCNTTNNINNIMAAASNAATAAASAAAAAACVGGVQLPNSVSNEDLSQSLSEYTDADESISAPTEFLAEFLSAVMLKDYKKALKYCKLILQYEPDNSTAKEFYPLILDKLRGTNTSSDSDENYNKSSSPELIMEAPSSDPSAGESDEHDDQYLRHIKNGATAYAGVAIRGGLAVNAGGGINNSNRNDPNSNVSSSSGSANEVEEDDDVEVDEEGCGSIDASLSDEDVEDDDDDDEDAEEGDDCDDEEDDDDEDDIMSSSGDDLPVDEQQILVGDVLDLDASSANACGVDAAVNSSRNSSSGGKVSSRSDNTTHSYSSLLLEEEDDIVPANLHFPKDLHTNDLDVSNGNKVPSTSCSDSESPTEPLTQRLAAILRSKCGVSNTGG
ncbi:uncharacterized protein ACRADG_000881 isoform 1-T8 [Cochliomyia hominivorax]